MNIDADVKASSDPTGKDNEELQGIAEWHAQITNLACDCRVCTLVAARHEEQIRSTTDMDAVKADLYRRMREQSGGAA